LRYVATKNFTRIGESAGTIQNSSPLYTVEISDRNETGSGILLYPKEKVTVRGSPIYIRCIDGAAYVNVVTFVVAQSEGGSSSSTDDTQTASDDAVDGIINDAFSGNIDTDPDADAIAQDMWNSPPVDTGDGFSDDINAMFNP